MADAVPGCEDVRGGSPAPPAHNDIRDRGSTLIEVVVTIVLIGSVVLGVLSATRMSVIASSSAYRGAQIETVMLNAADRVQRAPQICSYEAYVDAAAQAQTWPVDTTSSVTERLTGTTGNPAVDWTPESCLSAVGPFDVQRVRITVTTPTGEITRSMIVVKSKVG